MSSQLNFTKVNLEERWPAIQSNREAITSAINELAKSESGGGSKQLSVLGRWFGKERSYEDALKRPDVLAVCLALTSLTEDKRDHFSGTDIRAAVRSGFSSIVHNGSVSQHLLRAMMYPFLILMGGVFLAIFFSVFVSPHFEEMYEEFGIALPTVTLWVLDSAGFMRRWAWVLVFWLFGGMALFWIFNYLDNKRRQSHMSWLDNRFLSTRDALAGWAWHISLLLQSGVAQPQAIWNAGFAVGKARLKEQSVRWSQRKEADPYEPYFLKSKFSLLNHALMLPPSNGKVKLLQRVAAYYRSRNRNMGQWWIGWLSFALYWLVGFIAFICVLSIFMPMMAIVSGLTGGR